jgi:hypothetical protein
MKMFCARFVLICVSALGWCFTSASAEVFLAKDEALNIAFAEDVEIHENTKVLSQSAREQIEHDAYTRLSSNIFHYYEGRRNGAVVGYAIIDSRIMRSHLAAFMVVLTPDRTVSKVVLLAFNEPSEYQPTDSWLQQLEGNQPLEELIPGQGIAPIAGSTLTVNGLSDGVRAVRASLSVVLDERDSR